jgi:hypothetical protein
MSNRRQQSTFAPSRNPGERIDELGGKQVFPARVRAMLSMLKAWLLAAVVLGGGALLGDAPVSAAGLGRLPVRSAGHQITVREHVVTTKAVKHGNSLVDGQGRGTGTFNCPVAIQVRVSYTTGTFELTCSMPVGNVTCHGGITYFTAGGVATFTGTLTIEHATGKYDHAQGRLRVEGTLVRKTDAVSVTMSGSISF